jgi:hypothetical protein
MNRRAQCRVTELCSIWTLEMQADCCQGQHSREETLAVSGTCCFYFGPDVTSATPAQNPLPRTSHVTQLPGKGLGHCGDQFEYF